MSRKIFVVGAACTGLELLYREVCRVTNSAGCGEDHLKVVNDAAIYRRNIQPALDAFTAEQRPVDRSVTSLWIAEQLSNAFPTALFVAFTPVVSSQVIIQMMRSKHCMNWNTNYRGIPFPSGFLGMSSEREFLMKGVRDRCMMRLSSHMREIKRLRDVLGGQRMLVFDYLPGWETLLRDAFIDLKLIEPTDKPLEVLPPVPALAATPTVPFRLPPTPRIPIPSVRQPPPTTPHPPPVIDPTVQPAAGAIIIASTPTFYWINLDRASERRASMVEQLTSRGIPNVRIQAFDGAHENLSEYVPKDWAEPRIRPAKGEIATTLSHLKALHEFYKSGNPVGIICEDDLIFEFEPKWPYTLVSLINEAPLGWDVLMLSITIADSNVWDFILANKQRYQTRRYNWHSALAYAVTRSYACSVLKRYSTPLGSDRFTCKLHGNMTKMASEPTILGLGSTKYTVIPPAFTYPTKNMSYIHPSHLASHAWAKTQSLRAYP